MAPAFETLFTSLIFAEAHSGRIDYLIGSGEVLRSTGQRAWHSIKRTAAAIELVSKERLRVEYGPRREGDPPELVADNALAKPTLGISEQPDFHR